MAWLSSVQPSSVRIPRLSRVKRRGGFMLPPSGPSSAKYTSCQIRPFRNDRRFPSAEMVRPDGPKSLHPSSLSGLPAASPVGRPTGICQRLYFAWVEGDSAAWLTENTKRQSGDQRRHEEPINV